MHLLEGSLLYTGCRRSYGWLAQVGRGSLVGRGLTGLTAAVGRYAAGSCILGTSRLRSVPLESADGSVSVRAIALPYAWLRARLADAGPGRAVRSLRTLAEDSTFSAGRWTRLVGGALVGAAAGRAVQGSVAAPVLMAVVGLLLVVWGPALAAATGGSVVLGRMLSAWRGAATEGGSTQAAATASVAASDGSADQDRRSTWVIATGVVVSAASGVVAGLVSSVGPVWLAAGVLAVVGVAVLLWRPEAVLLGAAAFPWLDTLARDRLGSLGAAWDEGLILASIALLLWGTLLTGRLRLRTVPVLLPALCALAAAVGSIVIRGVPGDVGQFALRVVLEPLLFYFLGFFLCSTRQWVRRTVTVFLASTTALALHGIYQYAAHVPTPTSWVDPSETYIITRVFSVIGNPNGLGSVLAVGFLVAVGLLLSRSLHTRTRLVLVVVCVVQLAALALTFSRGAWLGAACGLIAMLVLAYRRFLLPVLVVGAVGVVAAPSAFVDRFLLAFSESYLTRAAVDGRIYRWIAALDQIGLHPWFGAGLGTYGGSAASRYGYWATWVDNFYLQLGAEGGLLLLAAFVWLMLRVAKGLVKGSRLGEEPFERALAAGAFGAFVAVAVANMFASVFETLSVGVALWLLAGMATAATLKRATVDAPLENATADRP